jgi:putative endonuclease
MVLLYVLKSRVKAFRYVGISQNVSKRLDQHNRGNTPSTKAHRPFTIVYQEEHPDYQSARAREKYLKSSAGRRWLNSMLETKEEE